MSKAAHLLSQLLPILSKNEEEDAAFLTLTHLQILPHSIFAQLAAAQQLFIVIDTRTLRSSPRNPLLFLSSRRTSGLAASVVRIKERAFL